TPRKSAMEAAALKLLLPDPGDEGTQRCRVGPATLSFLGARIGAPLRISLPTGCCLCTAWPRHDLAEGYLQVDPPCRTAGVSAGDLKGLTLPASQLKLLAYRHLKKVAVKVVLKSSAQKSAPRAVLQETIRELLRNVYVSLHYVVSVAPNLENPVVYIEILSVDPLTDEAGLITPQTSIKIKEVVTFEWYRHLSEDTAKTSIAGLDDVGRSLKEMIDLPFRFPKTFKKLGLSVPNGVLLIGPPGVGKSLMVKAVAKEVGAYLFCISGPALYGSRPGESEENLRRAFEKGKEMSYEGPTILFIDEVDSLCPKRGSSNNVPEDRIVAQLLTLLDGVGSEGKMVIMAATNRPDALDPALRRPGRFDREVIIGTPTLLQRRSILQLLTSSMPISIDVDLVKLAEMTPGYVGADLTALCREAAMQAVFHSSLRFRILLLNNKCKLKFRLTHKYIAASSNNYYHLGCMAGCNIVTATRHRTRPKSKFLDIIDMELENCYFLIFFLSILTLTRFMRYMFAVIFRQARANTPAIIFLDEIDSILGSRSHCKTGHGVSERVLSVLLNELDGIGLKVTEGKRSKLQLEGQCQEQSDEERKLEFQETLNKDFMVVAATNRPDMLDDALLRPGRLDKVIYIPPPDLKGRLSILKICTEKIPLDNDVSLQDVAVLTDLFSGADIENLCKEAALLALQENELEATAVKHEHFVKSLRTVKPSLNIKDLEFYEKFYNQE
ncbi:SPA5L protein, partial [Oceanites oceanicus]|nr:SPA5L protein [Oceanites oceanicus]